MASTRRTRFRCGNAGHPVAISWSAARTEDVGDVYNEYELAVD